LKKNANGLFFQGNIYYMSEQVVHIIANDAGEGNYTPQSFSGKMHQKV